MMNIRKLSVIFALFLLASFGLAACGGSSAANQQPVDVTVSLTEFNIDSSITEFKVGVPYHFVVTNNGTVAHEFYIMPPKSGELTPEQVTQLALTGIGQDQLAPGATATLDYTFTQAYPAGSLEFACHLPGHYEAGMHTSITVTQ